MKAAKIILIILLLLPIMVLSGCARKAANGDTVRVNYTLTLDDGSTFDSSYGKEPLEVKLGEPGLIKAFADAIIGMKVGDKKDIHIPMEEGYGPRREDMVLTAPRSEIPEGVELTVGQTLQYPRPDGKGIAFAKVVDINDSTVTIDGNHPLAGQALNFEIELVGFVDENEAQADSANQMPAETPAEEPIDTTGGGE